MSCSVGWRESTHRQAAERSMTPRKFRAWEAAFGDRPHIDEVHDVGPIFACTSNGDTMPVCTSCAYFADYLCDAPMGEGRTCDLPLCSQHRFTLGPELDLCPIHRTQWDVDTGGVCVLPLYRPTQEPAR